MAAKEKHKKPSPKEGSFFNSQTFRVAIFCIAGIIIGWFANSLIPSNSQDSKLSSLRLKGYQFISPLLMCDNNTISSNSTKKIRNIVTEYLNTHIDSELSETSVYFRDIKNGEDFTINPDTKYYPASLNKIPLMMVYYKIEETNPGTLARKIKLDEISLDNNQGEIMPSNYLKQGGSYSIDELISYMIKYSDNNAYNILVKNIEASQLEKAYQDLDISLPTKPAPEDFMTATEYSHFLRVLFNATYLDNDFSEKALKLLSEVDYKEGLAKQLPSTIKVAHKYGLYSVDNGDGKTIIGRELHDCGIIYTKNPYLLCVMTKSSASLKKTEERISDISSIVYDASIK